MTFWPLKGPGPRARKLERMVPPFLTRGREKSEFQDMQAGFLHPIAESYMVIEHKVQRQKVRSSDWQVLLEAFLTPVYIYSIPHLHYKNGHLHSL